MLEGLCKCNLPIHKFKRSGMGGVAGGVRGQRVITSPQNITKYFAIHEGKFDNSH